MMKRSGCHIKVMSRNIYPAQLRRNKACPFTDALFDLLSPRSQPIALILSFDTGPLFEGPSTVG